MAMENLANFGMQKTLPPLCLFIKYVSVNIYYVSVVNFAGDNRPIGFFNVFPIFCCGMQPHGIDTTGCFVESSLLVLTK